MNLIVLHKKTSQYLESGRYTEIFLGLLFLNSTIIQNIGKLKLKCVQCVHPEKIFVLNSL